MTYHYRQPGRERAEIGRRAKNPGGMADPLVYRVFLEPDDDGYRAIIPAFPRVFTCGDSIDDALRMAKDAIELEISVARDRGDDLPDPDGDIEFRTERVVIDSAA
ncbi:MAG TPA: type II toxin-antitoxin system HicB family antitoxin [Candidatus Elarobacter sp.]|nr:type II toxin-antitoxin system HicB family antitoxin [Candidatus Elarobacter sp.]